MSWRDKQEAGSLSGIRFIAAASRLVGRRCIWLILYFPVTYFYLTKPAERKASRSFLERVNGGAVSSVQVFGHFMCFAKVTVDRLFFASGNIDRIATRIYGGEKLLELVNGNQGGVFLAAHFGSFEAVRLIGVDHPAARMRIVMDAKITPNFTKIMQEFDPEFLDSVIDPHQSAASLGVEIANTLANRQWVGFLADRRFAGERTVRGTFLGGEVQLPAGPFVVAATFKVPVVAIFPVLVDGRYDVYCEVLTEKAVSSRKTRDADLQSLAQVYLDTLETHVLRAPDNWFNFYDFWNEDLE